MLVDVGKDREMLVDAIKVDWRVILGEIEED